MLTIGVTLDGGARSPISYFLILPMLVAGLAYSAGMVTFLAGFGVVTWMAVSLLTPDRSWSTSAFRLSASSLPACSPQQPRPTVIACCASWWRRPASTR